MEAKRTESRIRIQWIRGIPSIISFADEKIAIGEQLPNNENYLKVNYSKTKGVIYSAGVVKEIVDKYDLDFSTRTSITFSEVKYVRYENHVVAIVTIV